MSHDCILLGGNNMPSNGVKASEIMRMTIGNIRILPILQSTLIAILNVEARGGSVILYRC